MITSAEEFVRLRTSEDPEDYQRSAHEEADISVWQSVLETYPEMAFWVAQNKTVQYEILELLSTHRDPKVRYMIASKGKLKEPQLINLAQDSDDGVRRRVAMHKKATLRVLRSLENDSWQETSFIAKERIESGSYK